MPKILFSSAWGPYPKVSPDNDPIDYFCYRNTFRQKMFQMRAYQSWHSLHYLAQNIAMPSVVLENPSQSVFCKEVNTGKYAVVAIGFTMLLANKVLEMMRWLREHHPGIEIVLGGYGVSLLNEDLETGKQMAAMADHVCFGEGVGFFNKLITEKWGIAPKLGLQQDFVPVTNSFFRTKIPLFQQIVLVSGLGCTSGCSFCATSSQYHRKHIPLFSGKALFDALMMQVNKHPHIRSAIIYDEDFLGNRAQVMEFMQHYEASDLPGKAFFITILSSVNSVLKYSKEELIRCGIGSIFIGVESLDEEVLSATALYKRRGDIRSLFSELHAAGINTIGSLVVGWDMHDETAARRDAEAFVALNPTFYQVVPLHVVPGTRMWEQMKTANRISESYDVGNDGLVSFNFKTKNLSHQEALAVVFSTYKNLVDSGGPWPYRLFENLLQGYISLSHKENAVFRERAAAYKKLLPAIALLAFSSRFLFNGKGFHAKWKLAMKDFRRHFPFQFLICTLASPLIVLALILIYGYGYLRYHLSSLGDQPDFLRKVYEEN